ncbi:MAG: type I polyketide synthase, partial [Planctomycetota bacterium]
MIATHFACRSLQDPANELALAGGVNALLLPDFYVAFSQLGVLSPDGRCKTFDATANGYVRSEGAGMVLLKRLDDAIRDGDQIYAVIRGSATNQDGRTDGMTVPSQHAQEELMRAAIRNTGIRATQVGYVEAHGTGTPVGDPIEAAAIGACYGRGPINQEPCRIASVKTNLGHLEAGAGIVSVIKVALALKHRQIPAHLNYEQQNPNIDFESTGLRVPVQTEAWESDAARYAAINGFGYGGANAHLILSETPSTDHPQTPRNAPPAEINRVSESSADCEHCHYLLPISAQSSDALKAYARRWTEWLGASTATMASIASAAACHRSHLPYRSVVGGRSKQDWIDQLLTIGGLAAPQSAADETDAPIISRVVSKHGSSIKSQRSELAFVCGGQGPQWWAMGRNLLQTSDVFRTVIQRCEREFAKYGSWSLMTEFQRGENESRMQETSISQPCLFALQIGLAAVWAAHGVRPTVLVGHSVGEIAAAYLSGALSFQDACCVAFHRGRTMDAASSKGAMLAVGLSAEDAREWLSTVCDRVSIAAFNGPNSLTLSGSASDIESLQSQFETKGVFCRRLRVEYAFHSAQMDPLRNELLRSLSGIAPKETEVDLISTVTGKRIDGKELGAEYWWDNVRQSVQFADAMDELARKDVTLAVELSPHPVLAFSMKECFDASGHGIKTIASMRRDRDDSRQFTTAFGEL